MVIYLRKTIGRDVGEKGLEIQKYDKNNKIPTFNFFGH